MTGIAFDTEPQAGDWLDIETTGSDGSGLGMHFQNVSPVEIDSDAGIVLSVGAGGSSLTAIAPDFQFLGSFSGTDDFSANVGGNVLLNGGAGSLAIQPGGLVFGSASASIDIFSNTASVKLEAFAGDVICNPGTGSFYVGTTGAPIVLITPDGGGSWNYHMKAGKAWIADL